MKKATLTLAAAMITIGLSAQLGTGLTKPGKSSQFKSKTVSSMGFSGTVPTSYSIKKYTPYPKSQGAYGTCASWATAYSAMTTQYAYSMNITNRNVITSLAFCPYYTHNNSKIVTDACASGNGFYEITNWLMESGAKKFYLPLINCASTNDQFMADGAKNYRIKGAYQLWAYDQENNEDEAGFRTFFAKKGFDVTEVKKLIANNIVPIFAAYLPPSFFNQTGKEVWDLSAEEKADPAKAQVSNMGAQHARHAMTIIGYDDNKFGGAFEIMNSWGSTFGNNGYIWVRYADLQKYVYQIIFLDFYPAPSTATTGCVFGDCNNGYGIAKFENGDLYEGFFTNGQYNGYGVYAWANGSTYDGSWKNGVRDGDATFYYSDGSYGGVTYSSDKFKSGYLRVKYDNGNVFEGSTNSNLEFQGYGKFTFATGDEYEGNFSNGNYDGLGRYKFANGTVHIGFFSGGQLNGNGLQITAGGTVWGGTWSYGKFTTGKKYGFSSNTRVSPMDVQPESNMNYVDANCTSGDCLNGKGQRKYNSGTVYEGEFKDGLENGVGKYKYANGNSLETYFSEGSYYGPAVLKDAAGNMQIGYLKDGFWDGYVVVFSGGSCFIGRYANGKYVGDLTSANVTEFTGASMAAPAHSTYKELSTLKLK